MARFALTFFLLAIVLAMGVTVLYDPLERQQIIVTATPITVIIANPTITPTESISTLDQLSTPELESKYIANGRSFPDNWFVMSDEFHRAYLLRELQ